MILNNVIITTIIADSLYTSSAQFKTEQFIILYIFFPSDEIIVIASVKRYMIKNNNSSSDKADNSGFMSVT